MLRMCSDCASYRAPRESEPLARCGRFRWWNGPAAEYAPCRVVRDATGECGIEARLFTQAVTTAQPDPLPWWRRIFFWRAKQ